MATEKIRYKAKIGSKEYTVIGESNVAHMDAVTKLMNEQLSQLKQLAPRLSGEDRAILMAFNAVSKQLKLQEQLNQLTNHRDD